MGSCLVGFETVKCRFEYNHGYDDRSCGVDFALRFVKDGKESFPAPDRELRRPVKALVPELHEKMLAHTDGG